MQNLGLYFRHYRLLCFAQNLIQKNTLNYSTAYGSIDVFSYQIISDGYSKNDLKSLRPTSNLINDVTKRHFTVAENKNSVDLSKLSAQELDNMLLELHKLNKDKELLQCISECLNKKVMIGKDVIKKLFRDYSFNGKVNSVEHLRTYSSKVTPALYEKNGEFLHYSAKVYCMKGNSQKGLSILNDAYKKHKNLRAFYRIILKELIHDSVMNRSEASMVTFKKYVLELSNTWNDSYPLVCFWHACWKSDWFSDQMLANELLEVSESLQNIIKEMASTLCLTVLKEYNEDAVTRLLQTLLKYKMMNEYTQVLHIFFNFKLKNKDIRGCMEILRNCEALGVTLPTYLQRQFIKILIGRKDTDKPIPTKTDFKLKF
ncbi:uncharacterized protein LOC119832057 [Zerene cesonia]|uniref:uncharacterized protein LOC119832057 n=1 Tax=Zerene cesonia TaxID=33412 RepID=UPI0018E4F68F|nr:uncharacterized protein LOC119832057 [Zerene cesonia]